MEIVHDLGKTFLCFVLTCHIVKADALRRLDVYSRVALAHTEGHDVLAAHLVHELFPHELTERKENNERQNQRQQIAQQRGHRLLDVLGKLRAGIVQTLRKRRVVHDAGHINRAVVLVGKDDLRVAHIDLSDLLLLHHAHEGAVIGLHDALPVEQRRDEDVEDEQCDERNGVIIRQRLFRIFDFFHRILLVFSGSSGIRDNSVYHGRCP